MASFRGVNAALDAIRAHLAAGLADFSLDVPTADLPAGGGNGAGAGGAADGTSAAAEPTVQLLGSQDFRQPLSGNVVGIYLHRITVDPHGRTRFKPTSTDPEASNAQELGVNLHLLLLASGTPAMEAGLLSWAMLTLANLSALDASAFALTDPAWSAGEMLTITPEDMTTEDLMRIWDTLDAPYTNSVPFIARTVRMSAEALPAHRPVAVRVLAMGRKTGDTDE